MSQEQPSKNVQETSNELSVQETKNDIPGFRNVVAKQTEPIGVQVTKKMCVCV